MEDWQRNHITTNLVELIENTSCNTALLAFLLSRNILSTVDVDMLNVRSSSHHDMSFLLYEILMTRSNAYEILLLSLRETKQTGAYAILENVYKSQGLESPLQSKRVSNISDVRSSTKWNDLAPALQQNILSTHINFMENKVALSLIFDTLGIEILEIPLSGNSIRDISNGAIEIKSNLPKPLKYYVGRNVEPRKQLKSSIFDEGCTDVFVFRGINLHQLTNIANGRNTAISSNQTDYITERFILLVHPQDFAKICQLGNENQQAVHLIEYKDGELFWVQSQGNISLIQKFVEEAHVQVSEQNFVFECLKSAPSQPVCISDTPGMGKTVLLANLGRIMLSNKPNTLVLYIVLHEFAKKLENISQNIDGNFLYHLLSEYASNTEVGREIVRWCLESENFECEVLLDGYDEVLSSQLDITKEAIAGLMKLKSTRLYVATRPHMREELERLLGVLGSNIHPFQEENQLEFLQRFWEEKGGRRNDRMKEFAEACLFNLKKHMTDFEREFAGIPLQCRFLAEVHLENALRYSNSDNNAALHDFKVSISVNSMFELYKNLVDMKFEGREKMVSLHIYLAMELLFPDWIGKLKLKKSGKYSDEDICKVGILERKYIHHVLRFIHRTLAEFLVAKYAIENKNRNDVFWQFLMKELLSVVETTELPVSTNGFGEWKQIESASFKFPVIAYFINAQLRAFYNQQVFKIPNQTSNEYDINRFPHQLAAAVCHDFEHLTRVLTKFTRKFLHFKFEHLKNLILLSAKHGGKENFKQVCSIDPNVKLQSLEFPTSIDPEFMITPLHIAIHLGKYELVEHLINQCGYGEVLNVANLPYLIHMSVFKSRRNTKISAETIEIIKLINARNHKYLDETLPDGTTPLLQIQVHSDLLHLLIDLGADVNSLNSRNESALHTIFSSSSADNNITAMEYDKLVSKVIANGYIHFNRKAQGTTPLHHALSNVQVEERTLETFVKKKVNMEALDDKHESVLFAAVKGENSHLLGRLIQKGADRHHQNLEGETAFHVAAKHGDIEAAIRLHSATGINATDNALNTPLHHAVTQTTDSFERLQMFLLENGADVCTVNRHGRVPLIHGIVQGNGLSMSIIKEMEKCGLEINTAMASLALKYHIVNRGINPWHNDWVPLADYLKREKGAQVTGEDGQTPWETEEVRANLQTIQDTIRWKGKLLSEAKGRGLLDEFEDVGIQSHAILNTVKGKPGSFELLLTALAAATDQFQVFQILRQSFQSHVLGSSKFARSPQGIDEFMKDNNSRVILISSMDPEMTIERIRQTVDPELQVLQDQDQLKSVRTDKSKLIVVASCFNHQFMKHLMRNHEGDWGKVVLIVPLTEETVALPKGIKHFREEILWRDLSSSCRKKLRELLFGKETYLNLSNVDFFKQLSTADICALIRIEDCSQQFFQFQQNFEPEASTSFMICPRNVVSDELFNYFVGDLLVFRGVAYDQVAALAKWGNTVGRSSEQRENPETDYIVLEEDSHLTQICEMTERNVHDLALKGDHFELVWSRGSLANVCEHVEANKTKHVAAEVYFRNFGGIKLIEGEFNLWGFFVQTLKLERREEFAIFSFLAAEDLQQRKFAEFCEEKTEPENIFANTIRLFFGVDFNEGIIHITKEFKALNIILGLRSLISEYDLPLFKRIVEKLSQLGFQVWIIVLRDIYKLEQIFGVWGYELQGLSENDKISLIANKLKDKGIVGFDSQAKSAFQEYDSGVLAKLPVQSLSICALIGVLLPVSPAENPFLHSYLIPKSLGQKESPQNCARVASMCKHILDNFINLVAREKEVPKELEECVRVMLSRIAMSRLYPSWMNLFPNMGACDKFISGENVGVIPRDMASYIVATLVVDGKYTKYLDQSRLGQFFRDVVFKCEGVSVSVFENHNICYFINYLLEEGVNEYFSSLLERVVHEWEDVPKCVTACVVGRCINILRVLMDKERDVVRELIDAELVSLSVAFGDVATAKLICDMYLQIHGTKNLHVIQVFYKGERNSLMRLCVLRGDHSMFQYLLTDHNFSNYCEAGCLHNCVMDSLFDADNVIRQKKEIVKCLVEMNVEGVKEKLVDGSTPLHVRNIHPELSKSLILFGADANAAMTEGWTMLHRAAEYLNPSLFHDLITFLVSSGETACFKISNNSGVSVLHQVVLKLHVLPETLDIFHDHQVNFKHVTDTESCVIHFALCGGANAGLVEKLVEFKADIGAKDKYLDGALHYAVRNGNISAIRVFLANGHDINEQNKCGNTPLHLAFPLYPKSNFMDIIRVLLETDVEINTRNCYGHTPLYYAIKNCRSGDRLKAINLLLNRGANL